MPPPPLALRSLQLRIILAAGYFWHMLHLAAMLYAMPMYWKQPLHTSALTGQAWVEELIVGHPERIQINFGMRLHVFLMLLAKLRGLSGLTDSKYVSLEEQLGIFLYVCVTGMSTRLVGERFQRSNETISKYFRRVLIALSSPPFYTHYVHLPSDGDPTPQTIASSPKFFPFFEDAIGSMDGTHINSSPPAADRQASRNRKGGVSMNCLACCSQDMLFQYMLSGWEGSTADATLFLNARLSDLKVPAGKYYLADAGFGTCDAALVPYRGEQYHLAEWGRADVRPASPRELFNLRHAQLRNVVERIFGVVKNRWQILSQTPEYDMEIQARIPAALAALHNFILKHDSIEWKEVLASDMADPDPGTSDDNFGDLARGATTAQEKRRSEARRDDIAERMWQSYQDYLQEKELE